MAVLNKEKSGLSNTEYLADETLTQSLRSQLGLTQCSPKYIDYCRFSESSIWSAQRQYYQQYGMSAWNNDLIPMVATSNPCIARSYAKVIVQYWQDALVAGDASLIETFTVVELGCGSGRFTYYLLKYIEKELQNTAIQDCHWRVISTDLSMKNSLYLETHPQLNELIASGRLIMGCFDAELDSGILLTNVHGEDERQYKILNAPVAITNYVFDSLTQDLFYTQFNQLYEGLVGLSYGVASPYCESSHQDVPKVVPSFSLESPFEGLELDFRWNKINEAYWLTSDQQITLQNYNRSLDTSVMLFPTGALQCIDRLRTLFDGRFMMLSADKGACSELSLRLGYLPELCSHGSMSFPVQYRIIEDHLRWIYGEQNCASWSIKYRDDGLVFHTQIHSPNVCLFGATQKVVLDCFEHRSPDDHVVLLKDLSKDSTGFSLAACLSLLRQGDFDPEVLRALLPQLLRAENSLSQNDRLAWCSTLDSVWQNVFYSSSDRVFLFDFASFAFDLHHWSLANTLFEHLDEHFPEDSAIQFNLALVKAKIADWSSAARLLKASSINPPKEMTLQHLKTLDRYCEIECERVDAQSFLDGFCRNGQHVCDGRIFFTPVADYMVNDIKIQFRDPNISLLTRLPEFATEEEISDWIDKQNMVDQQYAFAVYDKEQGFIGLAGVKCFDSEAYFYFCIGTDFQGRGYGSEVIKQLLSLASQRKIDVLYSGIYRFNQKSISVVSKYGFKKMTCSARSPDSDLQFYAYSKCYHELDLQLRLSRLLKGIHSSVCLETIHEATY